MAKEHQYHLDVPTRFVHENPGEGKTLLLFLHGYADSGASFLRRAYPILDPQYEVLAPNGPFPLPQRVGDEWKDAYAWYFADFDRERLLIHPAVAARAVAGLLAELRLGDRRKILVGFSQGGYFLPWLARELTNVERLVTIGAGFRPEDFSRLGIRLPVSAVHGDADEVIPVADAQRTFHALGEHNLGGRWVTVPGMPHAINEGGRVALRELLADTPGPTGP